MSQHKKRTCGQWCRHILNWFSQIYIICSLVFLIIESYEYYKYRFRWYALNFGVSYIFYIIMCFMSPTFYYLLNRYKSKSIHKHMQDLYNARPQYHFRTNSYHYETRHYTTTDSEGNTTHHTTTEKVITHSDYEEFKYCSWRDISGIFLLSTEENLKNKKKSFIKLELDFVFEFADDVSQNDHDKQKQKMIKRNKHRDTHIEFFETLDLDGYSQYNFVKIGEAEPMFLHKCWFLLFTFLIPIIELYKMYVESFCINQNYCIRKLVSSRYNLMTEEVAKKYDLAIPKIKIYDDEITFNNPAQQLDKVYDAPTLDEIEESKNFVLTKKTSSIIKRSETSTVYTFDKNQEDNFDTNTNNNYFGAPNSEFDNYNTGFNGTKVNSRNEVPNNKEKNNNFGVPNSEFDNYDSGFNGTKVNTRNEVSNNDDKNDLKTLFILRPEFK